MKTSSKYKIASVLSALLIAPVLLSQAVMADEEAVLKDSTANVAPTNGLESEAEGARAIVPVSIRGVSKEEAPVNENTETSPLPAVEETTESSPIVTEVTTKEIETTLDSLPSEDTVSSDEIDSTNNHRQESGSRSAFRFRSVGNDLPSSMDRSASNVLANAEDRMVNQTVKEAVIQLLQNAATDPEKQLGATEEDRLAFAKSLGMLSYDTKLDQKISAAEYARIEGIANQLHAAYTAPKKQPLFLNGKAQPIFPFSSGATETGYNYNQSDIVRHVVYVETDYDTDGDGKRDLVKALVQIPKAAVRGDYKASTIFEALPYITGITNATTLDQLGLKEKGSYNMQSLYNQPAKRRVAGRVTTEQAARSANSKQWYYKDELDNGRYSYHDLDSYNYFLVRGYAVVSSSGLGGAGSEGFNTVGSDLEVAAFKNIIEWLNGKRVGFTDKTRGVEVKATDWSNGNVGMTGMSWGGTSQFGLATTGVEGLKTIVPQAGIASWYEFLNSQGTTFEASPNSDLSYLSLYVAGRILNPNDWNKIKDKYARYITQLNKDQHANGANYSDVWAARDYTLNADNIKIPALIVHGLNDDVVRSKNFEMMYTAFKQAGQDVKLYLHQGNHLVQDNFTSKNGKTDEKTDFYDLLNQWFSHYLYNIDNNIDKMPTVLAQNNYDLSKWLAYDSWESANSLKLKTDSYDDEVAIISSAYKEDADIDAPKRDELVSKESSAANLTYTSDVAQDVTIRGSIPVQFQAALAQGSGTNLPVNVLLVDVSDEQFNVADQVVDYSSGYRTASQDIYLDKSKGYWLGSNLETKDRYTLGTERRNFKVISSGWINLSNPDSGYDSASSTHSITPEIGEYHDYTVYLQPNLYQVKKGHRLALVFNTYDSNLIDIQDTYKVAFKTNSLKATIPIVESSRESVITYRPPAPGKSEPIKYRESDVTEEDPTVGPSLTEEEIHSDVSPSTPGSDTSSEESIPSSGSTSASVSTTDVNPSSPSEIPEDSVPSSENVPVSSDTSTGAPSEVGSETTDPTVSPSTPGSDTSSEESIPSSGGTGASVSTPDEIPSTSTATPEDSAPSSENVPASSDTSTGAPSEVGSETATAPTVSSTPGSDTSLEESIPSSGGTGASVSTPDEIPSSPSETPEDNAPSSESIPDSSSPAPASSDTSTGAPSAAGSSETAIDPTVSSTPGSDTSPEESIPSSGGTGASVSTPDEIPSSSSETPEASSPSSENVPASSSPAPASSDTSTGAPSEVGSGTTDPTVSSTPGSDTSLEESIPSSGGTGASVSTPDEIPSSPTETPEASSPSSENVPASSSTSPASSDTSTGASSAAGSGTTAPTVSSTPGSDTSLEESIPSSGGTGASVSTTDGIPSSSSETSEDSVPSSENVPASSDTSTGAPSKGHEVLVLPVFNDELLLSSIDLADDESKDGMSIYQRYKNGETIYYMPSLQEVRHIMLRNQFSGGIHTKELTAIHSHDSESLPKTNSSYSLLPLLGIISATTAVHLGKSHKKDEK